MRPSKIKGTPAPSRRIPTCQECASAAVRFDGKWVCPYCQKVGRALHTFGDIFTSRRMRRGHAV